MQNISVHKGFLLGAVCMCNFTRASYYLGHFQAQNSAHLCFRFSNDEEYKLVCLGTPFISQESVLYILMNNRNLLYSVPGDLSES